MEGGGREGGGREGGREGRSVYKKGHRRGRADRGVNACLYHMSVCVGVGGVVGGGHADCRALVSDCVAVSLY
jgi:hypothetical protein